MSWWQVLVSSQKLYLKGFNFAEITGYLPCINNSGETVNHARKTRTKKKARRDSRVENELREKGDKKKERETKRCHFLGPYFYSLWKNYVRIAKAPLSWCYWRTQETLETQLSSHAYVDSITSLSIHSVNLVGPRLNLRIRTVNPR